MRKPIHDKLTLAQITQKRLLIFPLAASSTKKSTVTATNTISISFRTIIPRLTMQ